ncbi:MAG: hypothetical protein P4L85_27850 [Paludisphaera borealis]|uniref:hypothetical protein n=1 Tax=Paludisphaera borealis TaxID=1387353 RepID=UPI00284E7B23|nr:hypothetical protein [Paludisphaera borealis]MDR3623199.1 hypothetical protein [Paludisphaera borealis]
MFRRDLFRVLAATHLAGWLRPWTTHVCAGAVPEGANAADVYRKAFDWAEGLQSDDSRRLHEASTRPMDDHRVDDFIRQSRSALKAIREAAAIDRCDWGNATVTTADLGRGRLNVANLNVVRVACLSARRHAKAGRGRRALDDVFAALTLAHRVGAGGVLFARVLECGGEVTAFQTLGRILPVLDRSTLDDLSRRLDALPPPEPASAAIGPESRFILDSLRAKLAAAGPIIEGDQWGEVGFDEDDSSALKILTGGDRAKLLAHLDATAPAFAELARRLDLPRPGCRAALDEFARTERSTQPIVAGLVENVWGTRHVVDRMRALRSMLRAGVALIRDGEPAFRAEPDPFGAGPFGLERRGDGWLIRSALDDDAKPEVSLAIGEPAAAPLKTSKSVHGGRL